MVWIIAYIIGMAVTFGIFAHMDAKYGRMDMSREGSMGRLISIVLWPLVLPFIILIWIRTR